MLNREKLNQMATLLEPTFESVKPALGKTIVFVIGATGDGKSTLMNYLHGCLYTKQENDLGNTVSVLSPESKKSEICKVGRNPQLSQTRYPQIIKPETENNNAAFLYCDLPGFFDSGSEAEVICSAMAPLILSRAALSMKGLVWVLSLNQFEVNKCEGIKKILGYLLHISKKNAELITESLTIVISRANSHVNPANILQRLIGVMHVLENSEQINLLRQIIERATHGTLKIVISDVFDQTGINRNLINEVVADLKVKDMKGFDFSNYSAPQEMFYQNLVDAAKMYIDDVALLEKNMKQLSSFAQEITSQNKKHSALIVQFEKGTKEQIEVCQQVEDHEQKRELYQKDIDALEQSKFLKEVFFKKEAEIVPGYHGLVCGPMDYNSPVAMANRGNAINQCYQQGYTHAEYNNCIYAVVPSKPKPGETTQTIIYQADYPVKVSGTIFNKGELVVPNSEKVTKGYEVTIKYQIGKGADTKVSLEIETKNTPEGKSKLHALMQLKEAQDIIVTTLEKRKAALSTSLIVNESERNQLQAQLNALEQSKSMLIDSIQKDQASFKTRKAFFRSVYDVARILEIQNEFITKFFDAFMQKKERGFFVSQEISKFKSLFFNKESGAQVEVLQSNPLLKYQPP